MTTEQDPNGLDAHQPGAKLDAGKPMMQVVLGGFAAALVEVARVGTYSAQKYTPNGWLHVQDGQRRYSDAMLRHWAKDAQGEITDPDTQLLHAAHTAWNALARLQLILCETTKLKTQGDKNGNPKP